jgi:hypothetical protein
MSEPDYSLDLDKERISSLEALQEDTFYSTGVFFGMMGDLEAGRPISYTGRIIPIVHGSEDGKDGHVHIEFYGKPAANPLVRLSWTDAHGKHEKRERNLPAVTGEMQPRLIQARVKAGEEGVERLTWLLPADFAEDQYDEWLKVEGQDQVDRKRAASCIGWRRCTPPACIATSWPTRICGRWRWNSICRWICTPSPTAPRPASSLHSRWPPPPRRGP